jgi:hypothetical protein
MEEIINADNTNKKIEFYCKKCNFKCSKKSNYEIHLQTKKHNKEEQKNAELDNICICGKKYKFKQGLWKHKQTCISNNQNLILHNQELQLTNYIEETDITVTDAKLVFELLKQNNEFNIQMYLNETCKNAMTIDEFLDYLQPTLEELEDTARLGYVEGITRIIMRGLKDLEEELRPFHCSDLKRETLFIKNSENIWEKETDEKPLMLKFVKAVGRKNFNNVNKWRQQHPNCKLHDSKSNDMFNQILFNSTSGRTEEEQLANYEKIIKNIIKESVIDKSKKNK